MAGDNNNQGNNQIVSFILSVLTVVIAILGGFFYVDRNYAKVADMKKENLRIEYEYKVCRLEDISQEISHLTRLNAEGNGDAVHIHVRNARIKELQRVERKMSNESNALFQRVKSF